MNDADQKPRPLGLGAVNEKTTEELATAESTTNWKIREPGFIGTVKQLTCCARCGNAPVVPRDKPLHYRDMFKPTMHFICDDCFYALPQ